MTKRERLMTAAARCRENSCAGTVMSTDNHSRSAIVSERLRNHKLSSPTFKQPSEVVRWFGAVQAQEFHAAKWALALRMREATNASIEEAFNRGEIVRTH